MFTKEKTEILSVKLGNANEDDVRKFLGLDSIGFALPEDLAEASERPQEQLCLSCWGLE